MARGYFVGDYEGLAATGTTFKPLWSASYPSGTDIFGTSAEAPFPAATIVPNPAEGAGVRASDFPAQRGRPTPS